MIDAAILVIFPLCMIWAAISDTLSMTIANRVSLLLIVGFFALAVMVGMPFADIALHAVVFASVLAVTFALFAFGSMGGGDAKMLAASALWIGWGEPLLFYLLIAAIAGGAVTLAVLVFRRNEAVRFLAGRVLGPQIEAPAYLEDHKSGVPYGIALGFAGLMVFPETPLAQIAITSLAFG
ncbi:A24 family peptidase [Notoacmeibacter ruber]|uniref:Peptidase n=1 Tax=Notoacmeibacter ruber TaxID=2670375 RepID=A0A3L7JEX1_9HYPH|nr:prepilin peptidase [Notoacmeibacter ruber]RLQ87022.1 peptidase [Notoacmeibacter ruber]